MRTIFSFNRIEIERFDFRSISILLLLFLLLLHRSSGSEYDSAIDTNHTFSESLDYEDDEADRLVDGSEIYDDPEETSTTSQVDLDHQTMTESEEVDPMDYDDEVDEDHIYADTMSIHRFQSKAPMMDLTGKEFYSTFTSSSSISTTTPRIPWKSRLWPRFLSKPTVLVGIVGSIVLGLIAGIVLIMFLIYRLRKRDEGSYVLDEGPMKSPSHAYTRVSSREFFA